MKDRSIVDCRHIKTEGTQLIKDIDGECMDAVRRQVIWTKESTPHVLMITPKQFKTFARLSGDEETKPNGKEVFKTSDGYVFEVKVAL